MLISRFFRASPSRFSALRRLRSLPELLYDRLDAMENGSRLLRLIAQLQESQTGLDQDLAIWILARSLRELNMSIAALTGAVVSLVTENDLNISPEAAADLRKIVDVAQIVTKGMDMLVPKFEPPEVQEG